MSLTELLTLQPGLVDTLIHELAIYTGDYAVGSMVDTHMKAYRALILAWVQRVEAAATAEAQQTEQEEAR